MLVSFTQLLHPPFNDSRFFVKHGLKMTEVNFINNVAVKRNVEGSPTGKVQH